MTHIAAACGADHRAHIEALLARYPALEQAEIETLLHWFRKEASALDMGTLASDPVLSAPYRAFKRAHIEPIRSADWIKVLGAFAVLGAILYALM